MTLQRRQFLRLAVTAATLPVVSQRTAWAQVYPSKSVRVIVSAGAGSAVDVIPRIVFEQLSKQMGQPFVIENRPGAGTTLAAAAVAKAESDGYIILASGSAHTVAPYLIPKLPYDTVRDIAGVIPLGSLPNVLVTSPEKGLKTIGAFVASAKANPGSFNFTSVGVGSSTHLSAELFRISAGFEAVHVPVRGGPEALTEILAGRADFYLCPIGTALSLIREGKLVGLVVSGSQRAPELPDVPTTSEAGFSHADYTFWVGLFVPAKTPRQIVNLLHNETLKALQTTTVAEKLANLGVSSMSMTPEQFDAHIKNEISSNALLVKAVGIKPS